MNTTHLMHRIRKLLDRDRDDLFQSNVNMATGKVDDALARELIDEYSQVISEIDFVLSFAKQEPA